MGHFKLVYQSYPLDLPVEEPRITLRASSGSWPGQELENYVVLDLEVKSPKFFFDPNNDPEDDVSQWLNPGLDTQWLKIPLKRFENRDYRSLQEIRADFQGEGTRNALTSEDWWEAQVLSPPTAMSFSLVRKFPSVTTVVACFRFSFQAPPSLPLPLT
ncbi:hypothetical protein Brsp03_03447 [Brucella sp. NBRC 12951]|jgi:hypothetical protein